MSNNRTKNSALNASISIFCKFIYIIVTFISRTFFIKILGVEYLGLNGLFTNVLTILSLAELGIGNAIIFKLYKPIADGNKEKIKTYVRFYKKLYTYIGIIIFIIGFSITPIIPYLISDVPNIPENIYLIYVLFVLNSAMSYFFIYKKSLLDGYQQTYKYNIIYTVTMIVQNIVQILILYLTKNYILYLILMILGTVCINVVTVILVNKKFPFITEKKYSKISKDEQKSIFDDVKSIVLYKIGGILSTGVDNIIISKFLGVISVGLLSNYNMIVNAIKTLLSSFFEGITASVGNLNTIDDVAKKESVYYQIILLSFYFYGYIAICVSLLINQFVVIWLGEDYLLSIFIGSILGFDLYIDGMRYANYTFRNTLGLFKKGRFTPLISSISNVVLSIILVKPLGIFGVLMATGLSRLFIMTMYDPYLLHKFKFHTPCKRFYINYLYYLFVYFVCLFIGYYVIQFINLTGFIGFIINGIILTIIIFIIFILFTFKKKEFYELVSRINILFRKK